MLHTHEVTGSSPVVSTKRKKSELFPDWEWVRIFCLCERHCILIFEVPHDFDNDFMQAAGKRQTASRQSKPADPNEPAGLLYSGGLLALDAVL